MKNKKEFTRRQAFTLIMDQNEDDFIALTKQVDFDISWKDFNGNNLLTQSIRYGLTNVFSTLMSLNVNIDTTNGYGNNSLMWSVRERQYKMFSQIVKKHPDLSVKNQEGDTAVKILLDYKDKKIIEKFILSMEDRKSLSLIESQVLQTEHHFSDYTIGVIGIAKLQLKLNNLLSDKSIKENKKKL